MDRAPPLPRILILLALLAPLGCSESALEPEDPGIEGSYSGRVTASQQESTLTAVLTLDLLQAGQEFSGSYHLTGSIGKDGDSTPVDARGALGGGTETPDSGVVLIRVIPDGCADSETSLYGTYRSDFDRFFLVGNVPLLDEGCAPLFTYAAEIVLAR